MGAPLNFSGDLATLSDENIAHYRRRFDLLKRLQQQYDIYRHFQFSGVPAPTDEDWHWWGKLNPAGYGAVVVLRGSGGAESRAINVPWVEAEAPLSCDGVLACRESWNSDRRRIASARRGNPVVALGAGDLGVGTGTRLRRSFLTPKNSRDGTEIGSGGRLAQVTVQTIRLVDREPTQSGPASPKSPADGRVNSCPRSPTPWPSRSSTIKLAAWPRPSKFTADPAG